MKCCRPDNIPFPLIHRRFQHADPNDKSVTRRFRVQDAYDGIREAIITHMQTFFLKDEPTCGSLGFINDPISLAEITSIWIEMFKQKCILVCFEEDENGEPIKNVTGEPIIVGCNMIGVNYKTDPLNLEVVGRCLSTVFGAVFYVDDQCDIFEKYGVDKYLFAFGLSVDPKYRGMGVGTEILLARNELGAAVGIEATSTVFTAIASQKIAEKSGFETLVEAAYDDIEKHNPMLRFPGIKTKTIKVMSKRLPKPT